jgi:uncharacterized membrane protein
LAHEPQQDDQGSDGPSAGAGRRHNDDPSAPAADNDTDSGDTRDHAGSPGVGADGELDPLDDEVVDAEVVEAVTRRVVNEIRTSKTVFRSWRGPVPPASELQAYDDVQQGFAERILAMSERALTSQTEVDTTLAKGDVASVRRGQWQSTGIVAGSLVGALTTALLKLPWEIPVAFLAAPVFEFGSSLVRAIREPRKDK